MKITVLAEAEAELLDAVLWYEEHRKGLGAQFHQRILETCDNIRNAPERFPIYEVSASAKRVQRALVRGFPFVVVFENRSDGILVLAVAHTSRDSSFWQNR